MKKILPFLLLVIALVIVSCNVTVEPTIPTTIPTTTTTKPIENEPPIEEDPPHVHIEAVDNAVEPTCTTTGLTEGKHCSECGEVLVKQESIPVKSHNEVTDAVVEPSCTKTGLTEGRHCSVCNTVIIEQQEIPMIPHTYDDKYDEGCNVCGFIRDAECAHKETEIIVGKSATCTEIGLTDGSKCKKCGEIIVAQEVVAPTGHGEYLKKVDAKEATFDDEGNIEYWECSKCGRCYNDEKATNQIEKNLTVIPIIPSYTITFVDSDTYEDKTERIAQNVSYFVNQYKPTEVAGYKFVGWYDNNGNKVDYIARGNNVDYILYTRREAIKYTITYVDAPIHSNVTTYTIEDEIILSDPIWSGLAFKNWTDGNNQEVKKIVKGTIGNITLKANWLSEENYAVSTDDNIPEDIIWDETTNRYYFIYELGEIDNIVVGVVDSQDKLYMESISFGKSTTITIEKSIADTISETISKSISKTEGWSESCETVLSYSQTTTESVSAEIGVEEFGVTGKIGASASISQTIGGSVSVGYGEYGSKTNTSTNEKTTSSTVAYATGQSTTITSSATIDSVMPKGTYSYVVVGKVKVFGIVTYDVISGNYYLDTFSVMDDELREKRLYKAPIDTTANITTCDELSFDISQKNFKEYVESYYYVRYDANGGEGADMHLSIVELNKEFTLRDNTYYRDGYNFNGWSTAQDDTNTEYKNGANASNLATGGEVVVLYAQWVKNRATIELGSGSTARHTIRKWSSWGNNYDDYGEDYVNPSLNVELLKTFGYTKFSVSITFYYKVDDWGDQRIKILSPDGSYVDSKTYEWGEGGWTTKTISFDISFDQVGSNGEFILIWDLSKDGVNSDTWFVGGTSITVSAQ